ncbi:MAG: thiamine pyrophosphate-dependent enzyme [Chloroflexota bacterium]
MLPGHSACHGCGAALNVRHMLKILGRKVIMVVVTGCSSAVISPRSSVPTTRIAYGSAGAVATGVRAALDMAGDTETKVLVWSGDGGTFDIGLQAMSGAAERNENIIWACNDNEAYMNTGIQRNSATPFGAWTATTASNQSGKKDIMMIVAGHRIPYAARASQSYPIDMLHKMRKVADIGKGFRFLHLYCPCPTGWRYSPELSMEVARRAVESNVFPLYEIENGITYTVQKPRKHIPVSDYLKIQGRFRHLSDKEIEYIQKCTDEDWERLLARADKVTDLDIM